MITIKYYFAKMQSDWALDYLGDADIFDTMCTKFSQGLYVNVYAVGLHFHHDPISL